MSQVTIFLAPIDLIGAFYVQDHAKVATENIHRYTEAASWGTAWKGEKAAEDAFDLTNNPSRQYEREEFYGSQRSVSVGDVVDVDGELFLCASFGWRKL